MENNDCVKKLEKVLLERGIADETYFNAKAKEVDEMMDDVYKKAAASPKPIAEYVYRKENIYANPETGGDL